MDPFRNPALQNAKLQLILENTSTAPAQQFNPSSDSDPDNSNIIMPPPPPAYHTVVDPDTHNSNMHSLHEADGDDNNNAPEVTINAATQIRGHGNIISIPQIDSLRIAQMVALMLGTGPTLQPQTSASQSAAASAQPSSPPARQKIPNINITVNCGATVVGDRNIVGPGLGDIARHMQIANQNRAQMQMRMQSQNQQQQQQQQQRTGSHAQSPTEGFPFQGPTPPMSRSTSWGSEQSAGVKRRTSDEFEPRAGKRAC